MLTKNISFKNFKVKKNNSKIKRIFSSLIKEKNEVLLSMSKNYKNFFNNKIINKYKNNYNFRVIGMGGSTLGTQAIYDFLENKIKKKFSFLDNLQANKERNEKKKITNLIVSKSGNTIETIVNSNIFIKKNHKNIFITENKNNYLFQLAQKIKAEIIHHNNYIGGRYSVLSEVGMLPAELMGLKSEKFRQYNSLIKNKNFLSSLIKNVNSTLSFIKNKKFNSIIINYDERSENLFKWYQQLVAESLGKKSKGILPIISPMPSDNHSLLQLYLDGPKNNFFTFFSTQNEKTDKINYRWLQKSHLYLKDKSFSKILYAQKTATEKVFIQKKIPFRSFDIRKRNEEVLGELFCFFILETILLGRALKVNPFDQPSVELIKKETKKILIN